MPPYIAQAPTKAHPQSTTGVVLNVECGLTSSPDVTVSPNQSPVVSQATSAEGTPDRSPTQTPIQEKDPSPQTVLHQVPYVTTCSGPAYTTGSYYPQHPPPPPGGHPGVVAVPQNPYLHHHHPVTCSVHPVTYAMVSAPLPTSYNPGGIPGHPLEGSPIPQQSERTGTPASQEASVEATTEATSPGAAVASTASQDQPYHDPLELNPTDPQLNLYHPPAQPQQQAHTPVVPIAGPCPYPYPYAMPIMAPNVMNAEKMPICTTSMQITHDAHAPSPAHVGQPQAHVGQSQAHVGQSQAHVGQPSTMAPTYTMAPMPQSDGSHVQSAHCPQPHTASYPQQLACCTQGACCHAVPGPAPVSMVPQYYPAPVAPAPVSTTPQYQPAPVVPGGPPVPQVSVTQCMELVWHGEFNRCFQAFAPNRWFLMPVDKPPTELSATIWPENLYLPSVPWRTFRDSAKVRFCCDSCGNGWTSMKGRVIFWFHQDPASGVGYVLFKLYGQQCKRCANGQFEHAMWYPDEVIKVIVNVYHRVGQVYYSFYRPPLRVDRRQGKPREQHNAELCQACKEGLCKEELMFT